MMTNSRISHPRRCPFGAVYSWSFPSAAYAGGAYLAADSAYSAATGHTMITGDQLTTEERVWAGIDAAVNIASMGSAAYLTKLAKAGQTGSTLLKGLATVWAPSLAGKRLRTWPSICQQAAAGSVLQWIWICRAALARCLK